VPCTTEPGYNLTNVAFLRRTRRRSLASVADSGTPAVSVQLAPNRAKLAKEGMITARDAWGSAAVARILTNHTVS